MLKSVRLLFLGGTILTLWPVLADIPVQPNSVPATAAIQDTAHAKAEYPVPLKEQPYLGMYVAPLGPEQEGTFRCKDAIADVPCFEVINEKVVYLLILNANRRIVFIATDDEGFQSDEDLRIGTTLSEVRRAFGDRLVSRADGSFSLRLSAGWVAFLSNPGKDRGCFIRDPNEEPVIDEFQKCAPEFCAGLCK